MRGKIHLKQGIYAINECQFIAPSQPVWVIKGQQLKVLGTYVSFKELQNLPRLIEAEEIEELTSQAKDSDNPQLKFTFDTPFL